MKCCNEDRQTPFCPLCGRQLRSANPLDGLLKHLRQVVKNWQRQTDRLRNLVANEPQDRRIDKRKGRLALAEGKIIQWQEWADSIAAIIARAEKENPA